MTPTAYFPFGSAIPTSEYLEHPGTSRPALPQSHPYFPDTTPLGGAPEDETSY